VQVLIAGDGRSQAVDDAIWHVLAGQTHDAKQRVHQPPWIRRESAREKQERKEIEMKIKSI
jgi:hypothetical protein